VHFDQPAPESDCVQIPQHQIPALHLHDLHPELPGHEPAHYFCLLRRGFEEAVHRANWAQRNEIDDWWYYTFKKMLIGLLYWFISSVELEWMLKEAGAVPSKIEKDPKQKVRDVLMSQLRNGRGDSDDDDDYWGLSPIKHRAYYSFASF
jgi:hypothetical protein